MRNSLLLLSTSLIALSTAPAFAQSSTDSDDRSERMMDTVMVTSQRIEQDIQDVPISVTAISGDELNDRQIDSFDQLQFIAPGITFQAGVNARQSATTIRGIGTSLFNAGVEGSTAIAIDGVILGREGAGIFDLADIERVEVLRGPQGTLFGKNASAGVISFVTKNPTDEFRANFRASYGSFNEVNVSGGISGPITDRISGRVSGYFNDRDGFVNNVNPNAPQDDLEDRREFGFRGKLAIDITDNIETIIGADYANRDQNSGTLTSRVFSEGGPGQGLLGFGPAVIGPTQEAFGIVASPDNTNLASDQAFFADAEVYGVYAETTASLGNFELISLTSYRGWESADNNDADLIPLPFLLVNSNDLEQDQFSQEFRLVSPQDARLRYVGGAFFFYQNIDSFSIQQGTFGLDLLGALPPGLTLGTALQEDIEEFNVALFGQGEFDVTDKFSLIGGLRVLYSDVSGDVTIGVADGSIGPLPGNFVTPVPLTASEDDVAVVWRVGAKYDFSEDLNVFATATQGYKSAGLDTGLGTIETSPGSGEFNTVEPEVPIQFEAGVRSSWWDGRLTANLTAFYTMIDDFQAQSLIPTAAGTTIFSVDNAGEVETFGFEADATIIPIEGLTLSGSVAFTEAQFVVFDEAQCFALQPVGPNDCIDADGDGVGDFQDLAGADLGLSPDWIFNFLGRYDFKPIHGFRPFVQAGLQYRSSTVTGNDNNPATVIDDYALLDFQLGTYFWQDKASFTLFGRNITQTDFVAGIVAAPFDTGGLAQFLSFESESTYGIRLTVDL